MLVKLEMGAQQKISQGEKNMQDKKEQVKMKLEAQSRRSMINLPQFCRKFGVQDLVYKMPNFDTDIMAGNGGQASAGKVPNTLKMLYKNMWCDLVFGFIYLICIAKNETVPSKLFVHACKPLAVLNDH